MKLSQADLETGVVDTPELTKKQTYPPPEQRTANPEKVQLKYNHTKATLWTEQDEKAYPIPVILEHISRFGYKLTRTLEEAIKQRYMGDKVLTLREADIAARGAIDLNNPLLQQALHHTDGILCEGIPGMKDSPWEVRSNFNRGVEFMKKDFQRAKPEQQQKATERMAELRQLLIDCCLPPWQHELTAGFHLELLKPEFQTWGQYEQEKKKQKTVTRQ